MAGWAYMDPSGFTCVPAVPHTEIHGQGHVQLHGSLHLLHHHSPDFIDPLLRNLQEKFVMDLQEKFGIRETVLQEPLDSDHGHLDEIGRRPLDGRVLSDPLSELPDVQVPRLQSPGCTDAVR